MHHPCRSHFCQIDTLISNILHISFLDSSMDVSAGLRDLAGRSDKGDKAESAMGVGRWAHRRELSYFRRVKRRWGSVVGGRVSICYLGYGYKVQQNSVQ